MNKVFATVTATTALLETFGKVLDLIEKANIESKEKRNIKLEVMVLKEQVDQLSQELRRKDGMLCECGEKNKELEKRIKALIMGVL